MGGRGANFPLGLLSGAHSSQGQIMPDGVALGTHVSISGCCEAVSTWAKVVVDGAERTQEALRVLGGFEALEHPFTLASR
jgi:hypothetical protein